MKLDITSVPVRYRGLRSHRDRRGRTIVEDQRMRWHLPLPQWLLPRPDVRRLVLDPVGGMVWDCIDGQRNIGEIGKALSCQPGCDAVQWQEHAGMCLRLMYEAGFITFRGQREKGLALMNAFR